MVRIAIVDDSALARRALRRAFEPDPEIHVIGEAGTGSQALRLVERRHPDLVTMDLILGDDDGIDVTAAIMRRCPVPVVIVTAKNPAEPGLAYAAVQAGALEVCAKLPPEADPGYARQRTRLIRIVKALARVPVVHRFQLATLRARPAPSPRRSDPSHSQADCSQAVSVVVIGASTGGPPVIANVLKGLPQPYPLPIVVAQHHMEGFSQSFANWLANTSGLVVRIVDRVMSAQPSQVFVAPATLDVVVESGPSVAPSRAEATGFYRPSVNVLFESAATTCGSRVAAIVLSGMGDDGARGMAALRRAGALTAVQHPDACVVASMPERAMDHAGTDRVLSLKQIAPWLASIAGIG